MQEEIVVRIDLSDPSYVIDAELYGLGCSNIWEDDSLLEDILETALGFFGL